MITLTNLLPPAVAIVLVAQFLLQPARLLWKIVVLLLFAAGIVLQFTSAAFSPGSLAGLLIHIVLSIALLLRQYAQNA